MFQAIYIDHNQEERVCIKSLMQSDLPDENVLLEVLYSDINYKDMLAITGQAPIARINPLVPGIDLVGRVIQSEHAGYKKGDLAILTGYGVGEKYWGGFSEQMKVNGDFLIPLPAGITPWQSMAIGTAGYTAMLCYLNLIEQGVNPDAGEIIISGASGGVGLIACQLFAKNGFSVTAVSDNAAARDKLEKMGVKHIVERASILALDKPLEKSRWAGAVDVVGGKMLANICASMQYGGVVAACGLVGDINFPATVAPFILRGIKLIGIDSVMTSKKRRIEAWERFSADYPLDELADSTKTIKLDEVINFCMHEWKTKKQSRIVIDMEK